MQRKEALRDLERSSFYRWLLLPVNSALVVLAISWWVVGVEGKLPPRLVAS